MDGLDIPLPQNVVMPTSLFSDVIPSLIGINQMGYCRLKFNTTPPIEWQDRYSPHISVERMTEKNWEEFLVPRKTIVYVPISRIEMHHKLIEREGHDRIVELIYLQKTPIIFLVPEITSNRPSKNGDGDSDDKDEKKSPTVYQLTFEMIQRNHGIYTHNHYVSCRSDKISEYDYPMMMKHSDENAERFRIRDELLQWYYSE
jgi:hypothetical protein